MPSAPDSSTATTCIPLNDQDRGPWLKAIAAELATESAPGIVIAASALKRAYREAIREEAPGVVLVHRSGDEATLRARMLAREDHFMPPSFARILLFDYDGERIGFVAPRATNGRARLDLHVYAYFGTISWALVKRAALLVVSTPLAMLLLVVGVAAIVAASRVVPAAALMAGVPTLGLIFVVTCERALHVRWPRS